MVKLLRILILFFLTALTHVALLPTTAQSVPQVNLDVAAAQGLISYEAHGLGYASGGIIDLTVTNLSDSPLEVVIPPGMRFVPTEAQQSPTDTLPKNQGTQLSPIYAQNSTQQSGFFAAKHPITDLITIQSGSQNVATCCGFMFMFSGGAANRPSDELVPLAHETQNAIIEAYCINAHLDNPTSSTFFRAVNPPEDDLTRLMRFYSQQGQSVSVIALQIATWMITDDVDMDFLISVGYEPTDEQFDEAISLLLDAGIDISNKKLAPKPTLTTPADGSTTTNPQPTLTWTPARGAVAYDVALDLVNGNPPPRIFTGYTVGTTFEPPTPLSAATYYWAVRGVNSKGLPLPWSATQSFTLLPPVVAVNSPTATENNSAAFTVSLSYASNSIITMSYAIADGTATSPADYTAVKTGTLSFAKGETSKTIPFTLVNDALGEGDETFSITLSNTTGGATISTGTGTATITDDEGMPTLTVNSPTIAETSASGSFTVTLTPASGGTVTVDYVITNGTAAAPTDYTATQTGTLTFTSATTSKTIPVTIVNDILAESDETFLVTLSNLTGYATIGTATGTATITDNDSPAQLSVNSPTVAEESGSGTFIVTINPASGNTVTVKYTIANGTATSPTDYTATATGTLSFVSSETSKMIPFMLVDDLLIEGNETIAVTLSEPTGDATILTASGTATIVDNEEVIPKTPTNLTAVGVSFSQINLMWANQSPTATEIWLEHWQNGSWSQIAAVPVSQTSYQDAGLPCGQTNSYRIRAFRSSDSALSLYSSIATDQTTACSTNTAAPARALYATTTPLLTWGSLTWATGYEIQVSRSPAFAAPLADTKILLASELSYKTIPLSDGTTYYWRVRAKKPDGTWSTTWSAVDSFVIDVP